MALERGGFVARHGHGRHSLQEADRFIVSQRFFSEDFPGAFLLLPSAKGDELHGRLKWLQGRCEGCGRGDRCWELRVVGLVQQVMVAAPYLVPRVLRGAGSMQV